MQTMGARLRGERFRLGLSQEEFAAFGQLKRRTVGYYESGRRSPDADFLVKLHDIGVDVGYVLIGKSGAYAPAGGEHSEPIASAASVAALYRALSDADKALFHALTAAGSKDAPRPRKARAPRRKGSPR